MGRGVLQNYEMLRIPSCLDNRLADGGEVVSPTNRPRFTPQKHQFSAYVTRFCCGLTEPQGLVRPEGLGNLKKLIHLIGSRIRDLLARSIVPQPLC
jgi:hypothetical protein